MCEFLNRASFESAATIRNKLTQLFGNTSDYFRTDYLHIPEHRTLGTSTMDAVVVDKSGLPEEKVRNYLSQLDVLGYITIGVKVSGADYRMVNMTIDVLQLISNNQRLR